MVGCYVVSAGVGGSTNATATATGSAGDTAGISVIVADGSTGIVTEPGSAEGTEGISTEFGVVNEIVGGTGPTTATVGSGFGLKLIS